MILFCLALSAFLRLSGGLHHHFLGYSDSREVVSLLTEHILRSTDIHDSSLTIIIDNTSDTRLEPDKFTDYLDVSRGISVLKVDPDLHDSSLFSNLQKIHHSAHYPLAIITSDNEDILTFVIGMLSEKNMLVWSTRLLVITSLPFNKMLHLKEILSQANAMILNPSQAGQSNIWSVSMYVPYSLRLMEIAKWSPNDGIHYRTNYRMFPNKFYRLQDGGHLAVTAEVYPPHIMERVDITEGENPFRGPVVEILNILTSSMNFTYTVTRPPDGAYGYQFQNGTWNGMIGMLHRKDVDFSFAPFNVLYSRAQAADYTVPFVIEYGRILARKGEIKVDPWGFFFPLTPFVWLLLVTSLGLIMLCSVALSFFLNEADASHTKYSLANYVRIFLMQDVDFCSTKDWSTSVLIATWMISILIVLKAYAGNLNSLLIARHVPQPYHTVRAVVDDSQIQVLWVAGGSYLQILQSFTSGVFKELADSGEKGKISFMGSTSLYEIVDTKVSSGDYTMVIDDLTMRTLVAEHFSKSGTCLFYLSRELFFPLMVAMVAQKYSPLIPSLDKRIIMINEGGLYDHWTSKEIRSYANCAKAPTKILFQSALSLQSLWGMFVVLGFGYLLSLLIFVMEIGLKSIRSMTTGARM